MLPATFPLRLFLNATGGTLIEKADCFVNNSFCQFILSIHCVSLKQPSNPHLLAHGASYVPTLCEIKRQTESNRGNQVDYDCPTNKLDLYGRSIGVSGLARSCDLKLNLRNLVRGTSPADAAEVHELGLKIVSFSMTPSGMDSSHGASKALRHELTTPSAQRNWKGGCGTIRRSTGDRMRF